MSSPHYVTLTESVINATLLKCHIAQISQIIKIALVANLSLWQKCHVNVANMFLPNRCRYVTLQKCHVNVANMFYAYCCRNVTVTQKPHQNRPKCHSCPNTTDPLQWKMTPPVENDRNTPPMENDPSDGNNSVDLAEGIMLDDSYKLTPRRGN